MVWGRGAVVWNSQDVCVAGGNDLGTAPLVVGVRWWGTSSWPGEWTFGVEAGGVGSWGTSVGVGKADWLDAYDLAK